MGLNIFSCSENERNKFYCYGTNEFKSEEENLKINTEDAALIFAEHYFKENLDKNVLTVNLDIIYNNFYVLSNHLILYNSKTEEYIVEETFWVNGDTKKIRKSDKNVLKIKLKIPKQFFRKEYRREDLKL